MSLLVDLIPSMQIYAHCDLVICSSPYSPSSGTFASTRNPIVSGIPSGQCIPIMKHSGKNLAGQNANCVEQQTEPPQTAGQWEAEKWMTHSNRLMSAVRHNFTFAFAANAQQARVYSIQNMHMHSMYSRGVYAIAFGECRRSRRNIRRINRSGCISSLIPMRSSAHGAYQQIRMFFPLLMQCPFANWKWLRDVVVVALNAANVCHWLTTACNNPTTTEPRHNIVCCCARGHLKCVCVLPAWLFICILFPWPAWWLVCAAAAFHNGY